MSKKALVLLCVLVLLSLCAYFFNVGHYFTFDELKKNRSFLVEFVGEHSSASPLIYIGIYAAAVSLSLPVGAFMTILGGFLFLQPWGTLYAVIGALIGATIIFLIAKTALGNVLKEKAGPFLQQLTKGFQENAANYMLFLRFVPLFPFWVVNLAPAFLGVTFKTYVWTTAVGILPAAFAFAQTGVALGAILDSSEPFSIEGIFNTQMKIALIALGIVSLLPVLIKKIKRK